MSVEVALDSPLAAALNEAIQPKLVEVGWATGGADDSALSEYIILMLVNGKTQEQIASELSGDLLNLGPNDPGANEFAQWLFQQVEILRQQQNGGSAQMQSAEGMGEHTEMGDGSGAMDAEMGDIEQSGESNVPTGPKSMRNGANRGRDKRIFGQMAKAMDRSNESVLHRVGPHGAGRINTHGRGGPPTGPRMGQGMRGGVSPRNGRPMGMPGMMGAGGAAAGVMNMSPQQQMDLYAMLEQQSQMMAQMFTPQQQQAMMMGRGGPMGAGMGRGFGQQQQGRSLFDRVQGQGRGRGQQNGGFNKGPNNGHNANKPSESGMDIDGSSPADALSPDTTCKFNLSCTNKDCKFAHQSPAAPPGTAIDVNDTCSFGAACKNRKCTARHPSPAQKIAHQTEQDCKFFPNCTNPRCPFKHPTMPLCRNGADCTTPDCKFTHVKTMCKFNPCLNPGCSFKHVDGQKRGKFEDKVWTADGSKEHVSERKFVDEDEAIEELIVPGEHAMKDESMKEELIA